ncbi:hypothetical protein OPT61_g6771 [Boeremia exigua]|uniref:Uncharacterized protein n=1 Tax=Boeremia exigua TaxID=749465 RepID=A0ACC2I5W2_9PLEO|nr:hypothetical protein OPT61_g6771 [Boeremia exigua]
MLTQGITVAKEQIAEQASESSVLQRKSLEANEGETAAKRLEAVIRVWKDIAEREQALARSCKVTIQHLAAKLPNVQEVNHRACPSAHPLKRVIPGRRTLEKTLEEVTGHTTTDDVVSLAKDQSKHDAQQLFPTAYLIFNNAVSKAGQGRACRLSVAVQPKGLAGVDRCSAV